MFRRLEVAGEAHRFVEKLPISIELREVGQPGIRFRIHA
jgi:hypothetical protein